MNDTSGQHRHLEAFGWRFIDGYRSHEQHIGSFSESEALYLLSKEIEQDQDRQLQEDLNNFWRDPDYH